MRRRILPTSPKALAHTDMLPSVTDERAIHRLVRGRRRVWGP